jgi:LPXTG-motif cell wall-anchored protein
MKKLMVYAALLAVALVVAVVPAIAQDEPTNGDTTVGEAPGSPPPETAPPEAPPPDASLQEAPPSNTPLPEPDLSEAHPPKALPETLPQEPSKNENRAPDVDHNTTTEAGHGKSDGPADDTSEDAGHDIVEAKDKSTDTNGDANKDDKDQKADADAKDDDERDDKDDDDDDVEQDQDQDADSGDVDQSADVINTGDNVNQCVAILQVANSGNAQNQTGIIQDDSETDEIELDNGSRINITPQLVLDCRQIIMQVVRGERAKEQPGSRLRTSQLRVGGTPVVRTSGTQGRVGPAGMVVATSSRSGAAPKVASASGAGRPKTLPRTGGFSGSYATLLGLSVGVLLVGGGLVVRRISRRV